MGTGPNNFLPQDQTFTSCPYNVGLTGLTQTQTHTVRKEKTKKIKSP